MDDELSLKDRRRVQRAAMLTEFETVKKVNYVAALLCAGFGVFGVHRFYLGQIVHGLIILAGTILLVLLISLSKNDPQLLEYSTLLLVPVIGYFLFEIFRVSSETDKVNDKIKHSLETEFYK